MPYNALRIINLLKECGYEAWIVGGCVRDAILGRTPDDWDITTSALPDDVIHILEHNAIKYIADTGIKHGTVSAVFRENTDFVCYEITTYRSESGYSDGRHPDKVSFVDSVEVDLSRRDLTINAMASDGEKLIDPFGGQRDLKNKVIRAVGDPLMRFCEDRLRILRALRFASQLGFVIENDTLEAMQELAAGAASVSAERRAVELDKLLQGPSCKEVIKRCGDILDAAFITKTEKLILNADLSDPVDRDVLFALYFGKYAPAAARELKLSNVRKRSISTIVDAYSHHVPRSRPDTLRFMRKYGDFSERCLLFRATLSHGDTSVRNALAFVNELLAQNACFDLRSLAVDGEDMTAAGLSGSAIRTALEYALDGVIDGRVSNEKEELLKYLQKAGMF